MENIEEIIKEQDLINKKIEVLEHTSSVLKDEIIIIKNIKKDIDIKVSEYYEKLAITDEKKMKFYLCIDNYSSNRDSFFKKFELFTSGFTSGHKRETKQYRLKFGIPANCDIKHITKVYNGLMLAINYVRASKTNVYNKLYNSCVFNILENNFCQFHDYNLEYYNNKWALVVDKNIEKESDDLLEILNHIGKKIPYK